MLRLLGLVISIGLADSLNPATIGPALVLASGEHPRRRVLGFAAGTVSVFLLGGLVLTLGPGEAIVSLVPHPGPTARYVLETIAGAALLVVGVVLWRRRARIVNRPPRETGAGRMAATAARNPVLLGATISAIELPTAFPYFAVIAADVGSGVSVPQQIVLLIIYNVCFILPLLIIVLLLTLFPDRAVQMLDAVRQYLRRRWPAVFGIVAMIAGAFVITLGVTGLTGRVSGPIGTTSRRFRRIISR